MPGVSRLIKGENITAENEKKYQIELTDEEFILVKRAVRQSVQDTKFVKVFDALVDLYVKIRNIEGKES